MFANHIIDEGIEMTDMNDIMIILHNENNHERIDKKEKVEILKEDASMA